METHQSLLQPTSAQHLQTSSFPCQTQPQPAVSSANQAHPSQQIPGKDKKNYYLDASIFMTSVNPNEKVPKRIDDSIPKSSEINILYTQLSDYVNGVDEKMRSVIKDNENDFFIAFKNKMYAIMKEMRELKEKASKKERDWFRKEALKLDKICKDHKRILNKLKATLENIEEDRDFFQEQLFNAKKVNKALLMEVERYKSMSQGQEANSRLQLQYSTQPLAITNEESRTKYTASKMKRKIDAVLAQDTDMGNFDNNQPPNDDEEPLNERDTDPIIDYKSIISPQSREDNQLTAYEQHIKNQTNLVSIDEYKKIVRENAELKEKELKYVDTIKHLKNQIDNEKKHARSLRADKVNFMTQRNELEEFFLQCIEEVRKDIVKRKTISSSYVNKRLKKSTSTASMSNKVASIQSQLDTDTLPNTKLEHFTATDKRKVIELLMSNENVLLFLYEKLFPPTAMSQQSTQSRGQTAGYTQVGQNPIGNQLRFMTDSGIPINTQNRSQTTVGGNRLNMNMNSALLSSEFGQAVNGALNQALPQGNHPGMIQNNIQNINLNINLAKAGYGSQPFLPMKGTRGATAPLGQQRMKKGFQTQLNAMNPNKYAL